jgi:serine protease inhibitor
MLLHLAQSVQQLSGLHVRCLPPQVFNRPFLFFLVDGATQTVLFQGAITNPNGSS